MSWLSNIIGGAVMLSSMPPGALNPDVSQANIGQTICVRGWTKTIRPPVSYTSPIKMKMLAGRGDPRDYELDHVVPLELGGHPTSLDNLWLQPWDGPCGAHAKDDLENALHRAVCTGAVSLADAQRKIAAWCK